MSLTLELCLSKGSFNLVVDTRLSGSGVTAVFGPSGSGKTSFLRCIAGLEPNTSGRIMFGEQDWLVDDQSLPTHRRAVALVFQEASLLPHLTVQQHLAYASQRAKQSRIGLSQSDLSKSMEIDHLHKQYPHQLSGGQRQRVAITTALCSQPRLLLLDEPLTGLDYEARSRILGLLDSLKRRLELPMLYVTHSIPEVARLADDVLLLEQGRLLAQGRCQELLADPSLSLAQHEQAESIVEGEVVEHDAEFGLSTVRTPFGDFCLPQVVNPIGTHVRVLLAARDISLTLTEQQDTSILNRFKAEVTTIQNQSASTSLVRLIAGGQPLLAQITRKSVSMLRLQAGSQVVCQAKSVALV